MNESNSSDGPNDNETSIETPLSASDFLRNMQEEYRQSYYSKNTNDQLESDTSGRGILFKGTVLFCTVVIVVMGVIGLVMFVKRGGQEQEASRLKEEKIVRELTDKYGAIPDWRKSIEGRDELFSAEVLEALSGNKRPVLLRSIYIKDVSRKEGEYVAKVYEAGLDNPDMYFLLKCTDAQGRIITEDRYRDSEFIIVASISDVRRPTKEDAEANDEEMDYIASGTCLEIIPMY